MNQKLTANNHGKAGEGSPRSFRILVADDEEPVRALLERFLQRQGYEVTLAGNGKEALKAFQEAPYDLVLTDLRMPGMSGLQLLKAIKDVNRRVPVVLISGYGQVETVVEALKHGAENFLAKPLRMDDLRRVVEQSLQLASLGRVPPPAMPFLEQVTHLEVTSHPDHIAAVVNQVACSAVAVGFCRHDLDSNLKLALVEAATNSMEHGNQWDPVKKLAVTCRLTPGRLAVTFRDQGPGFDHQEVADPTSPENLTVERGRGVFLMYAIMDQVSYNESGNEVTLIKRRSDEEED
ncbi:MAG: response regulator [Deltaproteobacteria bacterium]|nr:response regulator [Deltaproteobacteria bacterium]